MTADAELTFVKHTRKGPQIERALATRHTAVLDIPGTPPSFNVTAQAHWTKHRKAKRQWQEWLTIALMAERIPQAKAGGPAGLLRVEATAALFFKQHRRRDQGNFRVILEKALGDSLVGGDDKAWPEGRWLVDDVPDRYTFGELTLHVAAGQPRTLITLTYYQREDS